MEVAPTPSDQTYEYQALASATTRFSLNSLAVTALIHSPSLSVPRQTYSDYRHHETQFDIQLAHFCADLHDYLTLKWELTTRRAAAMTALEICHQLANPCDDEKTGPNGWTTTRGRNAFEISESIVLDGLVISMCEMFEDLTLEERAWLVKAPMRMCWPQNATIPYTHFGIGPDQTFGHNLRDLAWRVDARCWDISHLPEDIVVWAEFELGEDSRQYYEEGMEEEEEDDEDEGFVFVGLSDEEKGVDTATVLRFARYEHEFRDILDAATAPEYPHPHEHSNEAFPQVEAAISSCCDAFECELKIHVHLQTLINAAITLVNIGHTICDHRSVISSMLRQFQQTDRVVESLAWIFKRLFMKQRVVLARRPVGDSTFGRHL